MSSPADFARALGLYLCTRGLVESAAGAGGGDAMIRCFRPERHTSGDAHPSLRVDLAGGVWRCDVCACGGGALELVMGLESCDRAAARARLGLDEPRRHSPSASVPAPQVLAPQVLAPQAQSRRRRSPDALRAIMVRYREALDDDARAAEPLEWLYEHWRVGRADLDRYAVGLGPAARLPDGSSTWSLACGSTTCGAGGAAVLSGIKLYRPRWRELGGGDEGKAIAERGSTPGLFGGHLLRAGAAGGKVVLVVGGEKDALVAVAALPDLVVVANARGEGGWSVPKPGRLDFAADLARAILAAAPAGIVLALDANEVARGTPAAAAAFLRAGAPAGLVRAVAWPEAFAAARPKGGVAQFLLDGLPDTGPEALAVLVETAPPAEPASPAAGAAGAGAGPEIVISEDNVSGAITAAEGVLHDPAAGVYQRSGMLVRIIRQGAKVKGLTRPPDAAVISPTPAPYVFELIADRARWVRMKDDVPTRALPPRWAVDALMARGEWGLPWLEGVVEAPSLRPDGTVIAVPGYDEATGLLFESYTDFPIVPQAPSLDDARSALDILLDVIAEFPYVEPCDRAAALAMILTPFARHAIAGPAPLFAVRAPTPGTGKSLLADLAAIIATGRPAARMVQPAEDEEERKLILALGLEGAAVILIDNVERPLGSAALAAALTGRTFTGRLLGSNRMASVPMAATWIATGNNLTVKGDLGRRIIPIDLDARVERPEARTGFRYDDVKAHVTAHRGSLAVAAVTILRAFRLAAPAVDLEPFGSFESWSALVRSTLVWLGEADPCAGRERIARDSDPALEALRSLLSTWHRELGSAPRTLAEVVAEASLRPDLRSALLALDTRPGDREQLDVRRLGYALRKHRGRVVSGYRLEAITSRIGSLRWFVNLASVLVIAGDTLVMEKSIASVKNRVAGLFPGDAGDEGDRNATPRV